MEPDPSCDQRVREGHSLVLIRFTTWLSVKQRSPALI